MNSEYATLRLIGAIQSRVVETGAIVRALASTRDNDELRDLDAAHIGAVVSRMCDETYALVDRLHDRIKKGET